MATPCTRACRLVPVHAPQVRALWDFTATSENEISFEEDDILTLTGIVDGGWWEADLNGVVGFFPANYVEVVQTDEAVRPRVPRRRACASLCGTGATC